MIRFPWFPVNYFQLNQRLIEIFGCGSNKPFAGIPIILCGDLYQLPPVRGKPIYMSSQLVKGYITLDLWEMFQSAELTEVMRGRGDNLLIHKLNKIRVDNVDESVVILKERFISPKQSIISNRCSSFLCREKTINRS